MIDRIDKIWLYSELENEVVKKIHLHPTSDPQKIIDQWLKKDHKARILIFEDANKLAIYAN